MAWYHRSRERRVDPQLKQATKLAEEQKTKLAEHEEFKVAPLAMDTNLPVPVDANPAPPPAVPKARTIAPAPARPSTSTPSAKPATTTKTQTKTPTGLWGTLKWAFTEEEAETEEEAKKKAEEAKAKAKEPELKPELKVSPAQAARAAPPKPAPKPAPQVAPKVTVTVDKSGLTREEIAALKAKEAALEAKVDRARQDFKALAANEEKAEQAYKAYPAYAKQTIAWVDEMLDMAQERADLSAAAHYRKKIIEIRRDEPPKPKDEKPTFQEYMANPSKYKHKGKTGVSSGYHPTKKDLDKQPFKPIAGACTGWSAGYKAAENCKNCRAMGEASGTHIHCPCGCGSYVPIDRNYDPFGGQESPAFNEGKSSTRLW